MTTPIVSYDITAELYRETRYRDGTLQVTHHDDDRPIVLEISGEWGATAISLDPAEARDIGGALLQLAERIDANRDQDTTE